MDSSHSSPDEFVETSDVEELEDVLYRSPRNAYNHDSLRPLKRIKLAHHGLPDLHVPPSTPIRRGPSEVVAETPCPSQSSGMIDVDVNTSTRIRLSPQPKYESLISEGIKNSQNPLPLSTPVKQAPVIPTSLQPFPDHDYLPTLFPPFQRSTTPLDSPPKVKSIPFLSLVISAIETPEGIADLPELPQSVQDELEVPEPVDTSEGEDYDMNRLFSSPQRASEPPTASQASIASGSVPPSPDISSVAGHSMVFDPSPSPPASALSTMPEALDPSRPPLPQPPPEVEGQPEIAHYSRYSMRDRRPNQLKPYTADRLAYGQAIRAFPEAFVKVSGRERHRHRGDQYEQDQDEETQDTEFIADNNKDEAWGDLEKSKRRSEKLDRILNAIDGEEENEEDRRQRRAEEKEQKKEERERRKQEKERMRKEKEERAAIRIRTHATVPSLAKGAPSSPNTDNVMAGIMNVYELSDDDYPMPSRAGPHNDCYRETNAMDAISLHPGSDGQVPNALQSRAFSNHSDIGSELDGSSGSDELPGLDERKKEILHKMYPPGLAKKLLETGKRPPPPKKSKRAVSSEVEGDGPLLPGQSRVHRAPRGAAPKEIKGDSESELEMSDPGESQHEYPPLAAIWDVMPSPPRRRAITKSTTSGKVSGTNQGKVKKEQETNFGYESSPESELEFIDDSAIAQITDLRKNRTNRGNKKADSPRAEVTLIDYMLAGTRVFGKNAHRSDRKHHKKSNFKYDVTTSGARRHGHERQALLSNFDGYGRDLGTEKKPHPRTSYKLSSRRQDVPLHGSDGGNVFPSDGESDGRGPRQRAKPTDHKDARKREKRRRDKERKARIRAQGLCVVKPRNGGKAMIVSGFGRGFVTVDLEEEGTGLFQRPKIRQWEGPIHRRMPASDQDDPFDAGRRPPRSSPPPDNPEEELGVFPAAVRDDAPEEFPILKDSGIPFLSSGIAFNTDSYVRKGWLQELVSAMRPSLEPLAPLMPLRLDLKAYQIQSDSPLNDLCQLVEKAFQDVFDFATDIPDPDQRRRVDDWSHVIHHVGHGISNRLAEPGSSKLKEVVQTAATRLVLRIKSLDLSRNALDLPVFQAHWLAVELCIRVGGPILNDRGELTLSPLNDSIQALVYQLLVFGLERAMKSVTEDMENKSLSDPTLSSLAAELWTRLIHLISAYDAEAHPRKRVPIFWQFVLTSFKSLAGKDVPDAALSEDLWRTLFSLCALSQFSMNGMTLGKVNLPACWDVVNFLCEGIFKQMDTPSVIQDSYIRYILSRCFILNERWGWKITDVSALVKLFVDKVFAPRKFANLEGEKPEFPQFLRAPQEDSMSTFDPKDPAYILLLKFIVKASKEESAKPFSIKKLISLSEPVATVRFKKEKRPEIGEMSMVINRITAAIIGVRLNPISYEAKINQVRNCITFAEADSQTRYTLIRGLQYWAHFDIHQEPDLSIEKLAPWVGDMAVCLADEWKKNQGEELVRRKLLAKILLRVVYHIIFASPEPSLLVALKPLFSVARADEEIQLYVRQIMVLIIDRWYKTVPPERPPPPKEVTEEESQDMYADAFSDIDWGAVDIPQELAADVPPKPDPVPLKQALTETNVGWIAYRCFKDSVENGRFSHARVFLSCWVGCRLLTTQQTHEKESDEMIKLVDGGYRDQPGEDPLVRIVDVILCLSILERCPMAYTMQALTFRLMRNFFRSLICIDNAQLSIHSAYVASLLSVDYLQHSLLQSCNCLPPRDPDAGVYEFTRAQFLEFRLALLDTVFSNMDALIAKGDPKVPTFIPYYQAAFSAMRNNLVHLGGDPEQRIQYTHFCSQVVESLKKAGYLANQPEMRFWTRWTPVPSS